MTDWLVHLKSSLWDTDARSFDSLNSFRYVQRTTTWPHRSVSCDWEIHRYFPKRKYTRDHQVPLSNSCQSSLHPPCLGQRPPPMLAPLFRFFLVASDAKKGRDYLLQSFVGVLAKRRLPETSAITAALDCSTSSYLLFSPQNAVDNYHKMIWRPLYLPVLVIIFNQLLRRC